MEDLFKCHGKEFSCKIQGNYCEGKITVENNEVYLCQDIEEGDPCTETHGYKYSYRVSLDGNIMFDLPTVMVTEFKLKNFKKSYSQLTNTKKHKVKLNFD